MMGISTVKVSGLCASQPQHPAGDGGQEGAGKGQSTAMRQAQAINLQCACNPVVISTVESIFILSDHLTRATCQGMNVVCVWLCSPTEQCSEDDH